MATTDSRRKIGGYYLGRTIGEGGFSKVRLGEDATTGEKVALKILKKAQCSNMSREAVEREISVMTKLKHPHVIQLKKVDWDATYTKKNGRSYQAILIVLELATGGELFDFLSYTGCFEEAIGRTYFKQLIDAVDYCHGKGIAHRDLKPENLLLTGDFQLKIADFGFSKSFAQTDGMMSTQLGTPGYMAPEMSRNQGGYDARKADIWACGVILFIVLAGFPPIQSPTLRDWWFHKLATNKHALFWQAHSRAAYFSEGMKDLINKILQPDPTKRITIEGIKAHPWFNGPVIAETALLAELTRRHKTVNSAKQAEEIEKKRRLAAAQHQQNSSLTSQVHRGEGDELPEGNPMMTFQLQPLVSDLDDSSFGSPFGSPFGFSGPSEDVKETKHAPQVLDNTLACWTSFKSEEKASEIVSRVNTVIEQLNAQYSCQDDEYRTVATVLTKTGKVVFSAQVFREEDQEALTVQFHRLKGNAMQFRSIYHTIQLEIKDIIQQQTQEAEETQ